MPPLIATRINADQNSYAPTDLFSSYEQGLNFITGGWSRQYLSSTSSAWINTAGNFSAGMGDTVSGGLTGKIRRGLGYDDVVDYNSTAYRVGGYAGAAVNIGLMVVNPTGLAAVGLRTINLMSVLSGGIDATQAVVYDRDYSAALMLTLNMGLTLTRGAGTACQVATAWGRMGNGVGQLAGWGLRGLNAYGVVQGASSGVAKILEGDIVGGMLSLVSASVSARRMLQSCFAAGTPLLWEQGSKPIEAFAAGERGVGAERVRSAGSHGAEGHRGGVRPSWARCSMSM